MPPTNGYLDISSFSTSVFQKIDKAYFGLFMLSFRYFYVSLVESHLPRQPLDLVLLRIV